MISMTKTEAARFLLLRQGLLGKRRSGGAEAVMDVVRDLGSIQYDPVDVFGRSPELTLLARVERYDSRLLQRLLYGDRRLCEYFDKCMCIYPVEDLRYFARVRRLHEQYDRGRVQTDPLTPAVLALASEREYITGADLDHDGKMSWSWGHRASVARAAVERLYSEGRLVIHHRAGAQRAYSLPQTVGLGVHLDAPDPNPTEEEYFDWAVRRRVHAVGMLADRGSDAWLWIVGMKAQQRHEAFARLCERGELLPVDVEGKTYYIDSAHRELAEQAREVRPGRRCELIAPLDNLLWDRKLIRELFDFSYTWEIYTPKEKRRYGYYVVPVLYGDRLVARAEPVRDRRHNALRLESFWPEKGFAPTPGFRRALEGALRRLARFNDLEEVVVACEF